VELRSVELTDFRAWKSLTVAFRARASALVGPNGSGKTSVLEAAWYAASLGSHRTSTDTALVRKGQPAAIVRASVERAGRTEALELEILGPAEPGGPRGGARRARTKLGGAPVTRRRDVLGVLRASIFAPERQSVIRGDPGDRRRFVDELLVQLHPRYHAVMREYERALRQRNTLLRDNAAGRASIAGIEAWDEALIGPGAELSAGRARAVERLAPHAAASYEQVGDGSSFAVAYLPNVPWPEQHRLTENAAWAEQMRERLAQRRQDEIIRGVTLVGPHRDDVQIDISEMPARTHASHGEGWLAALALVLGGHNALAEAIGEQPVLLLDDPFTLLDPVRRLRLVEALPAEAQVLVTAADPAEIPAELGADLLDIKEAGVG
jgi:DNA replication and repair protein RecF